MKIAKSWGEAPADHLLHFYLCRCGISTLESKDGGGSWGWRPLPRSTS